MDLIMFLVIFISLKCTFVMCQNNQFVLLQHPHYDYVYPWTIPTSASTTDEIFFFGTMEGSPIQTFFSLHANVDLTNLTLTFEDDFRNYWRAYHRDSISIASATQNTTRTKVHMKKTSPQIDLKVVKVWDQDGLLYLKEGTNVKVPELLVNDDRQDLKGGWNDKLTYVSGVNGSATYFDETNNLYFNATAKMNWETGGVEFYMKPVGWNGTHLGDHRYYFATSNTDVSSSYLYIYSHTNTNFYAVYRDGITDNWNACSIKNYDCIFDDTWIRVTVTWNTITKNLKMYINGNNVCDKDTTVPGMNKMNPSPRQAHIGGNAVYSCGCHLDEIKVFNTQPSDVEVLNENYGVSDIDLRLHMDSMEELVNKGITIVPTYYKRPTLREKLETDIPFNTTKQFFLKITPNKRLKEGEYTTNIIVSSYGRENVRIPVRLKIYPINLLESNKLHMLYHQSERNQTLQEIFFQDMSDHNINGMFIGVSNLDILNNTVKILKKFPKLKNIVFSTSTADLHEKVDFINAVGYGNPAWIYGIDEANYDVEEIIENIKKSDEIHSVGGKVCTAILKQFSDMYDNVSSSFYDHPYNSSLTLREAGMDGYLDWANFHTSYLVYDDIRQDDIIYQHMMDLYNETKRRKPNKRETYYWQAWSQKYKFTRAQEGTTLYLSKLDGTFFYHYIDRNDYDAYGDHFIDDDGESQYRDLNVVYPQINGVISTLQWEAVLEGIIDYRYLYTFEQYCRNNRWINYNVFSEMIQWVRKESMKPFLEINTIQKRSGKIFHDLRQQIVDRYMKMRNEYVLPFYYFLSFTFVALPLIIISGCILLIVLVFTIILAFTKSSSRLGKGTNDDQESEEVGEELEKNETD